MSTGTRSGTKTETLMILKYGSVEEAFTKWTFGENRASFSTDEKHLLAEYAKKIYPNLRLSSLPTDINYE